MKTGIKKILEKYYGFKAKEANWNTDSEKNIYCAEEIAEYLKNKAIEFAQFCRENYTTDTSDNKKWYKQASGGMTFTTEELYKRFSEHTGGMAGN